MTPRELLVRCPLFAELPAGEAEKLAALLRQRRYRPGEPVFREGDPGTALYVIQTGEVRILLGGSDGKEVVLALLGPGEFFGELALLDGEPRSADAVVTTAAELHVLPREDFLRFLRDVPSVAVSMLASLSRRFRRRPAAGQPSRHSSRCPTSAPRLARSRFSIICRCGSRVQASSASLARTAPARPRPSIC